MNKNFKKMILEELEMFLLLEDIKIPDGLVARVKKLASGTRSGQTLAGADDDVIKIVYQIQKILEFEGEELDGVYGPVTHAAILAAQGPYKPDS